MLRRFKWPVILGIIALATYGGAVLATPGSLITSSNISVGRFGEIDVKTNDAEPHKVMIKTKGESDVYVVSNTIASGGHTGWHSHPGPSLVTVKSGTATEYHGDDPNCEPHVYVAGTGFVDPGDGSVHILRNEGSVDLVTVAVQILPAGAVRRIDMTSPGNCPF